MDKLINTSIQLSNMLIYDLFMLQSYCLLFDLPKTYIHMTIG